MYKQQSRGQFHFGDKATDEEYDGKDVDSGKVIQSYRRILDMSLRKFSISASRIIFNSFDFKSFEKKPTNIKKIINLMYIVLYY